MTNDANYEEKLEQLRQQYRRSFPIQFKEIDLALQKHCQSQGRKETFDHLYRLIHRLAGNGATFGFQLLSQRAKAFEMVLSDFRKDPSSLLEEEHQAILEKHIAFLKDAIKQQEPEATGQTEEWNVTPRPSINRRLIFWFGFNPEVPNALKKRLTVFDLELQYHSGIKNCKEIILKDTPDLIVLDYFDTKGNSLVNFQEVIQELNELHRLSSLPVIHLCPGQDLNSRLKALRAGVKHFLSKPFAFSDLIHVIDQNLNITYEEPFRILLIDDDKNLTDYMTLILQKAGMQIQAINDPLDTLKRLTHFKPDLILLDLHMPQCSGLEIAQIIRQDQDYLGTPIVYLSAEKEPNKQLKALSLGGDDFIAKPVKYRYLFHAISSRIKRARQLHSYMHRDSLTGFLNHSMIKPTLDQCLEQAKKNEEELTFALLDIDKFQDINDAHGYNHGDQIIKLVAVLLKRRLGTKAILGRYGGVLFSVLLPKANLDHVSRLLEHIRQDLPSALQDASHFPFQVSFSAGLANYPICQSTNVLFDTAFENLKRAENLGQNQMVWETPPLVLSQHKAGEPKKATSPIGDDLGMFLIEDDETLDITPFKQPSTHNKQKISPQSTSPSNLKAHHHQTKPHLPKSTSAPTSTIVLVDDDHHILELLKTYLEAKGFRVWASTNGDEGFQLVHDKHPALVLTDLLLFPGIHGFELCTQIKKDPKLSETKVILMTGIYKNYRHRIEGKEAGADDFLEKPIDFTLLMQKIKAQLKIETDSKPSQ